MDCGLLDCGLPDADLLEVLGVPGCVLPGCRCLCVRRSMCRSPMYRVSKLNLVFQCLTLNVSMFNFTSFERPVLMMMAIIFLFFSDPNRRTILGSQTFGQSHRTMLPS